MSDNLQSFAPTPLSPARDILPVTFDVDIAPWAKALYVAEAGDVEVITAAGNTRIIPAVPAGTILPVQVRQVKSANTDPAAANIWALVD